MRKFLLLIAVALFSTATYAQIEEAWNSSISAVGVMDAVDFNSPAAMDKDGNLYVTGTLTQNFEFAGKDTEVDALGAYIAKYNSNGDELFAITLHGSISITAITTDADNNFYVAGSFADVAYITDIEGIEGDYETIENSEADSRTAAFIAKYDADGNLLAVKSYEAVTNAPMMDVYYGNSASVSIENIAVAGANVYAQLRYNGDVVLSETTTLVSKYVFAWFSFYLDCASTALISYDSNLENPSTVAELAITEDGGDATSINSFAFAIDGDDVYVAAMGQGDLALTTSAGTETFKFEYDGMGTAERGAILAKVGSTAVKFSNIPNSVSANYESINGIEVRDGKIYLAGTFGVTCAFDNSKVAVGASDVFVASIDANELTADWVYTNANDEGATNKYYEDVTGVAFGKDYVCVVDAVTDMNNNEAPVAKGYAVSYAGEGLEIEAIAATAVAYNNEYVAFINYTDATYVNVFKIAAVEAEVKELWNSSISAVGEMDAVDFNSPAAMDKDGNIYVTGTQTQNFEFAGKDAEVLAIGAYVAKYNAEGEELFSITLHGSISITAITTDADNNFYVAGSFADMAYITGVDGVSGDYEIIENSEADSRTAAFIAKYDADGNLLAVKSYEAVTNAPMMDVYYGNSASVSIENIAVAGANVYAQLRYNGDVVLSETTTLVSKYVFAWFSFYLDCASTALISYDSNLENPSTVAELAITEDGGDATSINSFAFAIDGDDVYVAAMGQGDLALTTSAGTETFKFEYDGMGTAERGAILAKVGSTAVKFSNIPNSVSANYESINGIEVRDGKIYLAGTFGVTCAFDNSKVAVGASDVFVASIDANELTADWVYTNANDEGATNKYYEEVTGVAFGKEHVYIVDAITDMNNGEAPVAKNYAVSYTGEAKEAEAIAATTVAYNNEYVAFINYTDATYIRVYNEAVTTEIESVDAEVEENVIYDLTGRRIEKITNAGIYIVNGNKVLVK